MFQMIDPGVYLLKLLDFGMAELVTQPTPAGVNFNRTGEAYGNPLYLSPEQSLGLPVDQRSDIFFAGLYFLRMCYRDQTFPWR